MKMICFNWKMNGNKKLINEYSKLSLPSGVRCIMFPPSVYLSYLNSCIDAGWLIGAQACHASNSGAFTGSVSATMLADLNVQYVLVGHSERRDIEGNDFLRSSIESAESSGLQPILCVGEALSERQFVDEVLEKQLSILSSCKSGEIIVAYEPRWAIGTGLTPEVNELRDVFLKIRSLILKFTTRQPDKILLLYGGSLSNSNFDKLLSTDGIDGALVGGAGLNIDNVREMTKC